MWFRALDTMIGRIFLILLFGICAAGTLGLTLSERRRTAEVRHIQALRAMERAGSFLTAFGATALDRRDHEAGEPRRFVRLANSADGPVKFDPTMTDLLRAELPKAISASVFTLPVVRCEIFNVGDASIGASGVEHGNTSGPSAATASKEVVAATDCWRIDVHLDDESKWAFVTGPPPLVRGPIGFDVVFLGVVALAAASLALCVAVLAGAPIRQLTRAAGQINLNPQASPLVEAGPGDVRVAIRAFNRMRERLGRHATEQMYMIAAITHDLQTPMTRIRLKLDQVEDQKLRQRLLADWEAMRAVVGEGLELARSDLSSEEPVLLDVDSLIHSIVEDEREVGNDVTFETAAARDWRCGPQMLRRCVQNLVDNAVNYGGAARLSTRADASGLRIEIRDHGPGIPADKLDAVFEPMVRLEASRSRATGGTGLGLTIARNLARRMGASLTLANAAEGGLVCIVSFGRSAARNDWTIIS